MPSSVEYSRSTISRSFWYHHMVHARSVASLYSPKADLSAQALSLSNVPRGGGDTNLITVWEHDRASGSENVLESEHAHRLAWRYHAIWLLDPASERHEIDRTVGDGVADGPSTTCNLAKVVSYLGEVIEPVDDEREVEVVGAPQREFVSVQHVECIATYSAYDHDSRGIGADGGQRIDHVCDVVRDETVRCCEGHEAPL